MQRESSSALMDKSTNYLKHASPPLTLTPQLYIWTAPMHIKDQPPSMSQHTQSTMLAPPLLCSRNTLTKQTIPSTTFMSIDQTFYIDIDMWERPFLTIPRIWSSYSPRTCHTMSYNSICTAFPSSEENVFMSSRGGRYVGDRHQNVLCCWSHAFLPRSLH